MRYMIAGGSHGPELTAIIEGLPAGLPLSEEEINRELARGQTGYGRGGRVKTERDHARVASGIRHGKTIGSPVTLVVENKDWKNWTTVTSITEVSEKDQLLRRIARPRPGHADLVDGIRYHHRDFRNVLEWPSTKEMTMRVAIDAIAEKILEELDIIVAGHMIYLGGIQAEMSGSISIQGIKEISEMLGVRVIDPAAEQRMKDLIDQTKKNGDTIGRIIEVLVGGAPAGLGSYVQWDAKLDVKIAQAVVSIDTLKDVESGVGFASGLLSSSEVTDEILREEERGYFRRTNNLGGSEGEMTSGELFVIRGVMESIPMLYKPLQNVDIDTEEPYEASIERSDNTTAPVVSVVTENVVVTVVATELLSKFPSDPLIELKTAVKEYRDCLKYH